MKINRIRSLAKAGMRRKNDTQNRPEERLVYEIISKHLTVSYIIDKQKEVYFDDILIAKLDIGLLIKEQKYAIRIMGQYHDELRQRRKDTIQGFKLESLGYVVVDLWYHKLPTLFLRNKRKLSEEELGAVWMEITETLFDYDIFLKRFEYSESLQD